MIGGALARPCISYPEMFPSGTIWERYPYLLPNLFSAVTVCFGVVIGLLFLEETHGEKKKQRDRGVELGKRISAWISLSNCPMGRSRKAEKQDMSDDDDLPGYNTGESSPTLSSSRGPDIQDDLDLFQPADSIVKPASKIFTKPVILNIVSYGILAL